MSELISDATQRNWTKLHITDATEKLTSRANKRNSKKSIVPVEYLSNKSNLEKILALTQLIRERHLPIQASLYTVAVNQLIKKEAVTPLLKGAQDNINALLEEYKDLQYIDCLNDFILPDDEEDLLGLLYQVLRIEGDRNKRGLYYTPAPVAGSLLKNLSFDQGERYLDPCCGSSNLLLNAEVQNPNQLIGIDNDPIAVMISKFNLISKYLGVEFTPQIFCGDFLRLEQHLPFDPSNVDYIVTNPPWGAVTLADAELQERIASGESFSYFLFRSLKYLKQNGVLKFLLPESFLNVKVHKDIRSYLIHHFYIESICRYPNIFTGVTTKFIAITIRNDRPNQNILIKDFNESYYSSLDVFKKSVNNVMTFLKSRDAETIDSIYRLGQYTLQDSTWALGIVTGDNKKKLSADEYEGWEPIYTGKEIRPYRLLPFTKYILYDRGQLQQVAKDEIYRAAEKLVYKFISKQLMFAYDPTGSLFLNSANILIPKIPGMSVKSVMAFLNSELFQYIYMKKFGEIKILKGNLMQLPFPQLTAEENARLDSLVSSVLGGAGNAIGEIQNFVYSVYRIDPADRQYIRGEIHGKAK